MGQRFNVPTPHINALLGLTRMFARTHGLYPDAVVLRNNSSGFFGIRAAPCFGADVLACKQGARACCVARLAAEQGAVGTSLSSDVLWVFGRIDLAAFGRIAQCH